MKNFAWLLLFFITFSHAQYTDIINSNRPGISTSPYAAGLGVLQLEGGFFLDNKQQALENPSTLGTELQLRYGVLFDQLEISVESQYQKISVPKSTYNYLGTVTFGIKTLLYEKKYEDKSLEIRSWKKRTAFDLKRLVPSVGIFAGYNTPFLTKEYVPSKESDELKKASWKLGILLQNNLSNRFVLVTNFIANDIGKIQPLFTYSIAGTYAVKNNFSLFFENAGMYRRNQAAEYTFGGGLLFLISKNLQVDLHTQAMPLEEHFMWATGIGCSWRLDRFNKFIDKEKI